MMVRTLLFMALVAGGTISAQAQTQLGEADVCHTAAHDLLSAMDGTWTVTHQSGVTITGAGRNPFPAPAPTTLQFDWLPTFGFGLFRGDGQSMAVLPADAAETGAHIDGLLSDVGVEMVAPPGVGCDWYALPALIGSTTYRLEGDGQTQIDLADIVGANTVNLPVLGETFMLYVCSGDATEDRLREMLPFITLPGSTTELTGTVVGQNAVGVAIAEECDRPPGGTGTMDMTLFLKFFSENSAAGVASFRGNIVAAGQRIRFAAQTPVTLSR